MKTLEQVFHKGPVIKTEISVSYPRIAIRKQHGKHPTEAWRRTGSETHILPSELTKLMIPRTCSLHT